MENQEKAQPVVLDDVEFDDVSYFNQEKKKPSSMPTMNDQDFKQMLEKIRKQSNAYVDKRLEKINATLKSHEERLTKVENILENHSTLIQELQKGTSSIASKKETEDNEKNIVDATLGTIGNFLHGVVDTTAYVLESTVDLITFGRAKRTG